MTKPGYGMLGFGMCEVTDLKPPTAKARILQALEGGQFTSRQLAKMLNISLGTVPATMSQLRDAKRVVSCGVSINAKNNVQSIIWRRI